MPDVINLLSSTPPAPPTQRPSNSRTPAAAATAANSSPRPPPSQLTFSDDIDDVFAYDDFHDKPAKKRRVSDESRQQGGLGRDRSRSPGASKSLFRFSDDEEEGLRLPPALGLPSNKNTKEKGSIVLRNVEESDPIVFTSSAPAGEPKSAKKGPVQQRSEIQRTNTITIDSDEDEDNGVAGSGRGAVVERRDEIVDFSDQLQPLPDMDKLMEFAKNFDEPSKPTSGPLFSNRTANLLASLESDVGKRTGTTGKKTSTTTGRSRKGKDTAPHENLSDDLVDPPQPKRKTTTEKQTSEDKEAKARNREAAKAQREREKQLEKERKAKLKEEKAKNKQLTADLAQVNKSKVDKKESTPEMIIDIDSSLERSSVGNQAVEFMKRLGVEYTFFSSSIPGIVKWRRKVKATFNEALGYWEPCALHVEPEKHVLCLLTAQDFADMVIAPADSGESLERHVLKIKATYSSCKPIYLIEGLTAWMRKNHNARNRAYQAEVRRQLTAQPNNNKTTTTTSNRRTKKPETTPTIDDDTIEDALLNLQVTHSCLIHHTAAAPESAEWLKTFTEHVSTIPYRLELMHSNDSAFCMDAGQVKAGEDKKDTFVKMLQEVNRVTASMAYGIVEQYPSVVDLVDGMKGGGSGLLEDVRKSANKNGALTEARIGPAVSRRLYKVFMGLDPSSTDI